MRIAVIGGGLVGVTTAWYPLQAGHQVSLLDLPAMTRQSGLRGHLGWTFAAGSSRVVADFVSGRPPKIDLTGLTLARYR